MAVDALTIAGLVAAASSGLVLAALLVANLLWPKLDFWPASEGWRAMTGLWLFRAYCAALIVVGGASLLTDGWAAWPRYLAGLPIIVVAYALSVASYRQLGRENTYFEAQGLVTDGFYALSRNPGYVASGIAAIGLAVVAWTWPAWMLGAGLFGIYTLFALNEERWLLRGYGKAFRDYMRRTPRFVDHRSIDRLTEITGP